MSVYLVTYDTPAQDYEKFHRFVDQFDAMRFSDSCYAIHSDLGPEVVYEMLHPLMGQDDLAYVLTLSQPWIGYGYEAMNDWLKLHVGQAQQRKTA